MNEAICARLMHHCVFLGIQSSFLFLIWQLFYALSKVISTDGQYISTARCRLVFRGATALPEVTTKSLSQPNLTITVWDCCWNRVTFPASWLSLCPFSLAFSVVHINSVFCKLTSPSSLLAWQIKRPSSPLIKDPQPSFKGIYLRKLHYWLYYNKVRIMCYSVRQKCEKMFDHLVFGVEVVNANITWSSLIFHWEQIQPEFEFKWFWHVWP